MARYRLDGFEISPDRREVSTASGPLALRPKSLDLLLYLIRNRERVVSKDELLRELWVGATVSENSVAQCIIDLRKTLGDDSRDSRLIKSAGKSGYRFVGAVEEVVDVSPVAVTVPRSAQFRPRWVAALAVATATVVIAGVVWFGWRASKKETGGESLALSMTSNLRAARAYAAGVEKARQLHVAEALKLFEEAIALDPQFAMAQARVGYVYASSWGRPDEGKPHLEKAFRQRGALNDLNRLYILAWYAEANRDFEGAIREYRELVARFPKESEALQQLGAVLLGEGRYEEARATLERARTVDPNSPSVHNSLSAAYLASKQMDRALEEAQRFVALAPSEPNAQDSLGIAYEARNDFEKAESAYRRALQMKPDFVVARIHLSNALFRLGRYREARAEAERYIADAPSDWERGRGRDQLGMIALRQGKLDEARTHVSNQKVGYHYGEILVALRSRDFVVADKLLNAQPEQADRGMRGNRRGRLYLLGERALAANDWPTALRFFQDAVSERTPLYGFDWYEDCLASALLRTGRVDEAIQEYRRVLELYPRLALTWHGLAKAYQAKRDPAAARQAFTQVLAIWERGDEGIPEREEARKALAQGTATASAISPASSLPAQPH